MRRAEPDCAANLHANPEALNTVVNIFTNSKKSSPMLNYLNNVDQEFKEVYEDCGTEDYFQQPKTDVMGDMAQSDRALCPFTTYLDVDPQVCVLIWHMCKRLKFTMLHSECKSLASNV